jgi:hypothetical protein
MSGLHRTPLTTSEKVECAAKALAGQQKHGTVSALSEQFGLSRPTLYQVRDAASELLYSHFDKDEAAHRAVSVQVDESQLRRAVVALRVTGENSIRAIEGLAPPCGRVVVASNQFWPLGARIDFSQMKGATRMDKCNMPKHYVPKLSLKQSMDK